MKLHKVTDLISLLYKQRDSLGHYIRLRKTELNEEDILAKDSKDVVIKALSNEAIRIESILDSINNIDITVVSPCIINTKYWDGILSGDISINNIKLGEEDF